MLVGVRVECAGQLIEPADRLPKIGGDNAFALPNRVHYGRSSSSPALSEARHSTRRRADYPLGGAIFDHLVPEVGFEPTRVAPAHFECAASAISPLRLESGVRQCTAISARNPAQGHR